MKHLLVILFICFNAIAYAQTGSGLNELARQDLEQSQRELDSLVVQILNGHQEDKLFIRNFRQAQKQWVKFRDADMEYKFPAGHENEQGSSRIMCYLMHKTYLNRQRIAEFKELVISEEGDVCR